jgi:hypothetical protein
MCHIAGKDKCTPSTGALSHAHVRLLRSCPVTPPCRPLSQDTAGNRKDMRTLRNKWVLREHDRMFRSHNKIKDDDKTYALALRCVT